MTASLLHKSCSSVLSVLMVMSLCVFTTFETGCSQKQFDGVITTVNTQLPAVENLASDLAAMSNEPQVAVITRVIAGAVSADLPILQSSVSAYVANKSSGLKPAIFAAVNTLASSINPQVEMANKLLNPQTQRAVLLKIAAIAAVVNGLQIALAPFFNKTVQAKADFMRVQPYIPRSDVEQVAHAYGYTAAEFGL